MRHFYRFKIIYAFCLALLVNTAARAQYQMENLDRGVVAVSMGGSKVYVSWRWLGTEPDNITFNLYRNGVKVNSTPLTVSNYTDNAGSTSASYTVKAIINGVEQSASNAATPWAQQYFKIPIQPPAGGTSPDGVAYTYNANDASIADLDGDGQWEIILKWDPTNSHDNSQSGYTGNTYVDAYKMNGTRMWRIDYGINIRSGAHYMDFMVYDFDGDGKAEMMCKTADGTKDGLGKVIGSATADYRASNGYVLSGPEYISVFNGQTGAVMATSNYIPARGTVSSWGDSYGNRVDRFRAGVAYVDGVHPTGIFCRGYYTRAVVAAWDWRGGKLTNRWTFDSGNSSSNPFYGQGDHSLSIADVDEDGKQEIIVGSAIIDDNGTGYYSTTFGHGDALHVSDLNPDLPGIEVFNIQERVDVEGAYMYNAKDKKVLWTKPTLGNPSEGPGRGVSADISAAYRGAESWVAGGGISGVFDCKGNVTGLATPSSCNFLVWWDGDLLRELLNGTAIDKYGTGRMLTANNMVSVTSNNGTKSTPCLSGDFFGDWREEVMWRASDNKSLYIFTTTIPTNYKFRTFMHEPQYRVAIAWQNTGYNQPPHVGFYLGDGMTTPPAPNISIVGAAPVNQSPVVSITAPANNSIYTAPASITISATATDADGTISKVEFYSGTTLLGTDVTAPYTFDWTNVDAGSYAIAAKAIDNSGAVTTSTAVTVNVCGPTVITPYLQVNGGAWSQSSAVSVKVGDTLKLGPQPVTGGSWLWSGPNGFSATTREIILSNIQTTQGGNYTATYTNAGGCRSSSTFVVTVIRPNQAPSVSITAPLNNASYTAPASVTISADAGDADGTVSSVSFYNGAALLGTDDTAPYSYAWSGAAAGTYSLTAKATDNAGAVTTSSAVTVVVTQPVAVTTLEAETACAADGILNESTNAGFNGTGYVNTNNVNGTSITWSVNSPVAQVAQLVFRYANASANNRAASVQVNGVTQVANVSFVSTSAWTTWSTVSVQVSLSAGNNTIKLVAVTAEGCANIDALTFTAAQGVTAGVCAQQAPTVQASVAPNPTSGTFTLTPYEDVQSVKVTDLNGAVVYTYGHLAAGQSLVYGSDFKAAIYTLTIIYTSGRVETKRIQKQ